MEKIIWKPIKGYEKYYKISNYGDVLSLDYNKTGWQKTLQPFKTGNGYLGVVLKGGKHKLVHRLVAETFIGEIRKGCQINHKDGDKTNNNAENLEIITAKENIIHKHYVLGKNVKKVLCVETSSIYGSIRQACREVGVKYPGVCYALDNLGRTSGGYHWKTIDEKETEEISATEKTLELLEGDK